MLGYCVTYSINYFFILAHKEECDRVYSWEQKSITHCGFISSIWTLTIFKLLLLLTGNTRQI